MLSLLCSVDALCSGHNTALTHYMNKCMNCYGAQENYYKNMCKRVNVLHIYLRKKVLKGTVAITAVYPTVSLEKCTR